MVPGSYTVCMIGYTALHLLNTVKPGMLCNSVGTTDYHSFNLLHLQRNSGQVLPYKFTSIRSHSVYGYSMLQNWLQTLQNVRGTTAQGNAMDTVCTM